MRALAGTTAAAVLMTATGAAALGLDRSAQDITPIFEPGNYAELSFGYTTPSLDGATVAPFPPQDIGNVGDSFSTVGAAVTYAIRPDWSVGIIIDQPYGASVEYPANLALGGTRADLSTRGITILTRSKFGESFGVHGGLRYVTGEGAIDLRGAAYGPLNGYSVDLNDGSGVGYVIGVSYERPAIALRVALTYASEINLSFDTVERAGPATVAEGDTTVVAPASWNLDFQTGIATDTLLFGNVRWADYERTLVSPDFFAAATAGGSLTSIDTNWSLTLGVGRRISDQLSLSAAVGYEPAGEDDLVSPLAPTNGLTSIQLGARYTLNDNLELSGGVRYTMVGDAQPATADTARASFTDNSATSIGMSVAYRF